MSADDFIQKKQIPSAYFSKEDTAAFLVSVKLNSKNTYKQELRLAAKLKGKRKV